jgi:hypothetical protein
VVEFEAAEKCIGRRRCHHVRSHSVLILLSSIGQRPQDSPDLLQGPGLQETYSTQSYAVQSWQSKDHPPPQLPKPPSDINCPGLIIRSREAKIRPQAVRLWWSDETCVQKEGEDNQEGRVEIGVHSMQDKGTAGAEAMQAFRTRVCDIQDGQ